MNDTKGRLVACFRKVFPELPENQIPLTTQDGFPAWDAACSDALAKAVGEEFGIGMNDELVASARSFHNLYSYLEARDSLSGLGFAMRLHHVGFVVRDIESSVEGFRRSLGVTWDGQIYADPKQRVRVTFLSTNPACAQIELVEPADGGSPVSRFLEKGGGQHHLCYEVQDIEQALLTFRKRKCSIIQRPCVAVAFEGRRIAWFVTPERLVVELLEERVGHVEKSEQGL